MPPSSKFFAIAVHLKVFKTKTPPRTVRRGAPPPTPLFLYLCNYTRINNIYPWLNLFGLPFGPRNSVVEPFHFDPAPAPAP